MVHLCLCSVILWSLALSFSQHHDLLTSNCFDTNCTQMGVEAMQSHGCLTASLTDVKSNAIKQKLTEVEYSISKRVFITDISISQDKGGCHQFIIMYQPPKGNGKVYQAVMLKFGNISESCLPNQPCTQHSGDDLRVFSLSKTSEDDISHACITLSCNTRSSYTGGFKVTLTAYPSHMESSGTPLVHYISFNKDDMVMSVARYPSDNDIRVVFGHSDDYSLISCVFSIFLCADSAQYPNITTMCYKKEPRLQIIPINQNTNSHTFKNLTSGKYSVEFVIDCQESYMDASIQSYKLSSYFVQIPAATTQQEDDIDTDNVVFAIAGCISGLILVVIMFIAMRRKHIHATCGVSSVDVKDTDRQKITNGNCSIEETETETSPFDIDFSTDVINKRRRSNHNKPNYIIDV